MAESSTASLPYVAVARGHLIQAQVHAADGNAGLIAASILQRLPRGAAPSLPNAASATGCHRASE